MHSLLYYISTFIFITGLSLLLIFTVISDPPTLVMYIISCYLMISGVGMAVLVSCFMHNPQVNTQEQLLSG